MPERGPQEKMPIPTIWRVPEQLWEKIKPILKEHDPPKNTGCPRIDQRAALEATIFRRRSGCQWNRLPKDFPDDSSVHRTFQWWIEMGILDLIWASLLQECEGGGVGRGRLGVAGGGGGNGQGAYRGDLVHLQTR